MSTVDEAGPKIKKIIYLDELTLSAFWTLLRMRSLTKVIVLEKIRARQKFWCWLLTKKGVHVTEAAFFAGHLRTGDGESVRFASRRVAGQIALIAAKDIVESEPTIRSLNEEYGRNTIRLFIAKLLQAYINYWPLRAMVAQALAAPNQPDVWLRAPALFDAKFLAETIHGVNFHFYPTIGLSPIKLIFFYVINAVRYIKLISGLGQSARYSGQSKTPKSSVLMLQEDNIRSNRSLRGQPHWLDVSQPTPNFDTFVVELPNSRFAICAMPSELARAGITVVPLSIFGAAIKAMGSDKALKRVRRDRGIAIRAVFHASGFANKFFLLQISYLLGQARLMGALALWLNSRVFLIRETYYSLSDAMQLVAPDVNVKTIAYQYSNMGFASPSMLSTADRFLLFSDMYKQTFQVNDIAPQKFVTTGYLYDYVANLVREKSYKHREILMRAGAEFIVCYFDESVQHGRWGGIGKQDHLSDLHTLAKTVLADPSFGVVLKSQFIHNSPSQLHKDDNVIQAAKATGRYLELAEGVHRNDIYPTEVALVADLCISHKGGATAAIEAALTGVRTVLLNTIGAKTVWDAVYAQADIEYGTIESLMEAIACYRSGVAEQQTIGDWSKILHEFDPYRDGKATIRLRSHVENIFN